MTNKTDFRLWIVAAMAVLSPVLTVTFTRGQETLTQVRIAVSALRLKLR